ncbi:ORFE hypothetical protein [Psittacine adenovirus 2]|nr:ORFE hypothetical protein [Psittacine adenovirus 2]
MGVFGGVCWVCLARTFNKNTTVTVLVNMILVLYLNSLKRLSWNLFFLSMICFNVS